MQISILTLRTFETIHNLTNNKTNIFVPWKLVREKIEERGFTKKQSEGELERFCYGFECVDRLCKNEREIALTNLGADFFKNIINESMSQSAKIAFLMRPAKRKKMWNVIIQESTFFNPKIYKIISAFNFRQGGARDFLRCVSIDELEKMLKLIFDKLSFLKTTVNLSIETCTNEIQNQGKYWASVGGYYSWIVFPQKFELLFSDSDWIYYETLMENLIRPPEWGGGKDVFYSDIIKILENEERFIKFYNYGIIRPIWKNDNIKNALFRLTAPGYLIWERKKKGFIFEFCVDRISQESYEMTLCDGTDFPKGLLSCFKKIKTDNQEIFRLHTKGNAEKILNTVNELTSKQTNLFV